MIEWLACPICASGLTIRESAASSEADSGILVCDAGHEFSIVRGVPRLLPEQQLNSTVGARSIQESFSKEWAHYDYDADRTWGQATTERQEDFLRHIDRDAEFLRGKVVLDAGCGNGALSVAVSSYGCDVVATDISGSVEAAHDHFRGKNHRAHFAQSDLMNLAVRQETFDVVYCAGVLHHTPDTRATFASVARAVAPGGLMFTWLYWREPGLRAHLSELLRRSISPLPARLKHAIVLALLPQSLLRNRIRAMRGRAERLNPRELLVRMLDSYTPRYRWTHTPAELASWYHAEGFGEVKTTEEGVDGFGVVARRTSIGASTSG